MAKSSLVVSGIDQDELAALLKEKYRDKEITMNTSNDNVDSTDETNIVISTSSNMVIELEQSKKQLSISEMKCNRALSTIQSFHKQQKALFEEFALLLEYDSQDFQDELDIYNLEIEERRKNLESLLTYVLKGCFIFKSVNNNFLSKS